tara:strand:- start:5168 stop:5863 length:696 start_codon:yes stop_codon:yes gene_type:complete
MKNIKLFEEFVDESNQPINEVFEDTPILGKIAKDLMKKHETLEMNAENFDKIQAVAKELADNPWEYLYKIANASKYADWLQEEYNDTKFLFDKSGKLKFIIAYVGPGRKIVKFTHIAELKHTSIKDLDQEIEDWAYENYPRLFKNLDWMVYQYTEYKTYPWKIPTEGTFELVSAPTKKLAMENTKANPSKDDSFWENHGIEQISKQDIKKMQKELKQKADHYAELVKTFVN